MDYRNRELTFSSAHGFGQMRYVEWGAADNGRVVVCVHGLTRNGRDFDALATELAVDFRIVCPDMPGRGRSDWLRDPNDYTFPTYIGALIALIARVDADSLSWVGTSMGGLLGIVMAGQPGSPVDRLVVNDIGPVIEPVALQRLGAYVGVTPVFSTFAELEAHIRTVSAPFGALTDAQWKQLSETAARKLPDGRWGLRYDPDIAVPFSKSTDQSAVLWALWDAIRCPTLVTRGAESDLLSESTAEAMTKRGPRPALIQFTGVGHAPMFLDADQIAPVARFLRA